MICIYQPYENCHLSTVIPFFRHCQHCNPFGPAALTVLLLPRNLRERTTQVLQDLGLLNQLCFFQRRWRDLFNNNDGTVGYQGDMDHSWFMIVLEMNYGALTATSLAWWVVFKTQSNQEHHSEGENKIWLTALFPDIRDQLLLVQSKSMGHVNPRDSLVIPLGTFNSLLYWIYLNGISWFFNRNCWWDHDKIHNWSVNVHNIPMIGPQLVHNWILVHTWSRIPQYPSAILLHLVEVISRCLLEESLFQEKLLRMDEHRQARWLWWKWDIQHYLQMAMWIHWSWGLINGFEVTVLQSEFLSTGMMIQIGWGFTFWGLVRISHVSHSPLIIQLNLEAFWISILYYTQF